VPTGDRTAFALARRPVWFGREIAPAIAALALVGCGDPTPLPDDVDAVLEVRCRRCHGDPTASFTPMPLVTWEDLHAPAPGSPDEAVYQVLARRIVDPMFPMPPIRAPEADAFTEDERQLLLEWVAAGAPPAAAP
jgi:hypothetical protein